MAPVASPINHYLRDQTIENCSFLSAPHARIFLIIAKEPLGGFRAVAAKAENGRREALLSESGATVHEAMQLLFLRSAEAAQHHIAANGFDFVPSKEEDDDSDFDKPSTRVRDDADVLTDESLSDNETVSVVSTTRADRSARQPAASKLRPGKPNPPPVKANTRRPRSRSRSRSRSTTRSRSRSASSSRASSPISHDGADRNNPHARWRGTQPHPGYGMQIRPPHMHAPWRSDPNLPRPPFPMRPPTFVHGLASSGGNTNMNAGGSNTVPIPIPLPGSTTRQHPPPPPPPPPPSNNNNSRPPSLLFRDVRLLIRLPGHSDCRVLEQAPLTVRGIQDAALNYLRRNAITIASEAAPTSSSSAASGSGPSGGPSGSPAPKLGPGQLCAARASVRRVTVDKVEYDISGYCGQDLQPLVRSCGGGPASVPLFEVEIDCSGPRDWVTSVAPPPPGMDMGMGMGMGMPIMSGGLGRVGAWPTVEHHGGAIFPMVPQMGQAALGVPQPAPPFSYGVGRQVPGQH